MIAFFIGHDLKGSGRMLAPMFRAIEEGPKVVSSSNGCDRAF
jgi:hypothetical protein